MTSKVFKAAGSSPRKLEVQPEANGEFGLCVVDHNGKYHTIFLTNDIAPALDLAILEAAGVEGVYRSNYNAGSDWQLEHATGELSEYVRARAAQDAEAKERAELEAEALELINLWRGINADLDAASYPMYSGWAEVSRSDQQIWLAVARRAREIGGRTEK